MITTSGSDNSRIGKRYTYGKANILAITGSVLILVILILLKNIFEDPEMLVLVTTEIVANTTEEGKYVFFSMLLGMLVARFLGIM